MASIFISYAREDEATASKIYDSLASEGHVVWMDRKNLLPGQDWKTEIEKAIQKSSIFIACLSTHSVDKVGFVQAELRRALEVADLMPEGRIYIIPVRLDDCRVPYRLEGLQWLNYFEPGSQERLLRAIQTYSNVEQDLEPRLTTYLIRSSPEGVRERFPGVPASHLKKALLAIAQKEDELTSVRSRAVRGLALLGLLDNDAWIQILPTASPELFQEWFPRWAEDTDTTQLTAEHIRIMLEGHRLPKASTGFGRAVMKFIERGAEYTSSVLLPGQNYPAWEVKLDCVRTAIQLDDSETFQTLQAFASMSYWRARRDIIDYLETKFATGSISEQDTRIAVQILKQFINDGKTEAKTPAMRRARELLEKIEKK